MAAIQCGDGNSGRAREVRRAARESGASAWLGVTASAYVLVLSGCFYAKPVIVPDSTVQNTRTLRARSVLLLDPEIIREGGSPETPNPGDPDDAAEAISTASQRALTQRGFRVITESQLDSEDAAVLRDAKHALRNPEMLAQPQRRRAALPRHLKPLAGADAVSFSAIRITQQITGGIPRRSSNLLMALVDLRQGNVVWIKEVFFRSDPPVSGMGTIWSDASPKKALTSAIEMLLTDFPEKEEPL
jgi:hypothetical protein